MQERVVHLMRYRLLIREVRFVELIHRRIQTQQVGVGRCAARVQAEILQARCNSPLVLS